MLSKVASLAPTLSPTLIRWTSFYNVELRNSVIFLHNKITNEEKKFAQYRKR